MIINDKNEFSFVHIPKCAGTMIRNRLSDYDDSESNTSNWIKDHPDLGLIDFGHLPLFTLRDYFKDEFDKVNNYWSFSFIRDPYQRFPSSFAQKLKMYSNSYIQNISKKELKEEIDKTLTYLINNSGDEKLLPAEYIHFQKQHDYIYIGKDKIIDSIYLMNSTQAFEKDFFQHTGYEIELGNKRNNDQSTVQRNKTIFRIVQNIRPVSKFIFNYISDENKKKISSLVYVPRDRKFKDIFESDFVKDFISDYYKLDIKLFEQKSFEIK